MRKREMSYQEYGFSPGEETDLKHYCRSPDFTDHDTLIQAAISANPSIAADLYYSLVKGLSFDRLNDVRYIPISKVDFYAYQRACLAEFKQMLEENEKGSSKDNVFDAIMQIVGKGRKRKEKQQISGQMSLFDIDMNLK